MSKDTGVLLPAGSSAVMSTVVDPGATTVMVTTSGEEEATTAVAIPGVPKATVYVRG